MLPAAIRTLLDQDRRTEVALELAWGYQDERVMQSLDEVGLRPLVLKGVAYGRFLYPAAYLRPRGDTDLWFPDRAAAEQAFLRLAEEGYAPSGIAVSGRYVSRQRTCAKLVAGGHALDLHWAISNTHTFARALPFDELERDAIPLPSLHPRARTLGPVDALLFACLHLFGHAVRDRIPLIWLYDILLLGRRLSDADWDALVRKAVAKRLAGICRHVLDRVDEGLGVPAYGGVRAAVRPQLLAAESAEPFRPDRLKSPLLYFVHDLKALESPAARLRWIGKILFPSAAYMRGKYGIGNDAWLPLFYLYRAASGVARRLGASIAARRRR